MASLSTIVNTMKMLVYCACQSLKVSHEPKYMCELMTCMHVMRRTEFDHGIIKISPWQSQLFQCYWNQLC